MKKSVEPMYYTVKDMMDIFQIGRSKAYALIEVTGFPVMRLGGKILIDKVEFENWRRKHIYKDVEME